MEKNEVVDTTGAGDAFIGAFLAAFVRGWKLEVICNFNIVFVMIINYKTAVFIATEVQNGKGVIHSEVLAIYVQYTYLCLFSVYVLFCISEQNCARLGTLVAREKIKQHGARQGLPTLRQVLHLFA